MLFVFQINELEQKVQFVEQYANETVEKYHELSYGQQNRQQIEQLKEKNQQLKHVSFQANKTIYRNQNTKFFFNFYAENNSTARCEQRKRNQHYGIKGKNSFVCR